MYRVINEETGQVYFEAKNRTEFLDVIEPAWIKFRIPCVFRRKQDGVYIHTYTHYTPELLAILPQHHNNDTMDKISGFVLAVFVCVMMLGLMGVL